MIQKFNTGIARRYGIAAALLAEAIWTEIKENEFHGRCQYDGETWMCCSRKMFLIRMPYLTKHMVSTGLARLKRAGVLIKDEWNKGQAGIRLRPMGGRSWKKARMKTMREKEQKRIGGVEVGTDQQ